MFLTLLLASGAVVWMISTQEKTLLFPAKRGPRKDGERRLLSAFLPLQRFGRMPARIAGVSPLRPLLLRVARTQGPLGQPRIVGPPLRHGDLVAPGAQRRWFANVAWIKRCCTKHRSPYRGPTLRVSAREGLNDSFVRLAVI